MTAAPSLAPCPGCGESVEPRLAWRHDTVLCHGQRFARPEPLPVQYVPQQLREGWTTVPRVGDPVAFTQALQEATRRGVRRQYPQGCLWCGGRAPGGVCRGPHEGVTLRALVRCGIVERPRGER